MSYPSVTRILDATMPEEKRAALAAWRARVGEEEADRIREAAFVRGRKIDADVDTWRLTGMCDNVKIAEHLNGYQFLHHELTVISEVHQYQGRLDAILSMNDRAILVDFKGAGKFRNKKYLADYEVQIGAYYGACLEMGIRIDCGCVCVFVDDRKRPLLHWMDEAILSISFSAFIERRRRYDELTKIAE